MNKYRIAYSCLHICVLMDVCLWECVLPFSAVRCVDLTVDATEPGWAAAGIAVYTVRAVAPISAGGADTLINVLSAALPTESSHTHTSETIHTIQTDTTIATGVWHRKSGRLIFRQNSIFSLSACDVCGIFVHLTRSAVVDVILTQVSCESWATSALESTHWIHAHATIIAWGLHTLIDVHFTCLTYRVG